MKTAAVRRRSLLLDPILVFTGLALALIGISDLAIGTAYQTFVDDYEGIVLRILVIVSLLYRIDRIPDSLERSFWKRLAAAFVVWLCADAVPNDAANTGTGVLAKVVDDAFYVLFYATFLLAIELRPHLREWNRNEFNNRVTRVGSGLFVFSLFAYAVLIPSYLNPAVYDSFVPSFYLFVALDFILCARLLYMSVNTARRRWRVCYGLLAVACGTWLVGDLWWALLYGGVWPWADYPILDAIMEVSFFLVIGAVIYRDFAIQSERSVGYVGVRQISWVRGGARLLAGYAIGIMIAHFVMYGLGLLSEESRFARLLLTLFTSAGLLAFAYVLRRRARDGAGVAEVTIQLTDEQVKQSQKMEALGHLAGGVAHDFNNLLTVIRGYTELLLEDVNVSKEGREYAQQINVAAQRASALTLQLLAFSRKQVFNSVLLDVNAVILETREMLRRLIGEDVELVTDTGEGVGRVHADPGQITQVLFNLAANARSAMPAGGRMTVQTRAVDVGDNLSETGHAPAPGRYVLLSVSDTGRGMDERTQAHIFEPFFTTNGDRKGTGLGLATVYGIVRQSGGFIDVESEPGRGTTFRIFLPMVARDHSPVTESVPGPSVVRGTETILVVEDEELVRGMMVEYLGSRGYRVLQANNGRQALDVVGGEDEISLLLTDLIMPEIGGRRLADEVRRRRPGIRVLYMSGYTDEDTLGWIKKERDAQFLQKPFPLDTLGRKVREVLDTEGLYGTSQ